MEDWQKSRIQNNLVELIRNTTCNVQFLSKLQQRGALSQSDYEDVQSFRTPSEQSRRLYEILQMKRFAFGFLLESLEEFRQTGALTILQQTESNLRELDQISCDMNHVLGRGRSGTKVYKGSFDGRDVAVKVVKDEPEIALNEVNFLKRLDDHENIIRYFAAEIKDSQIYIALELCLINLEDEMDMKLINPEPTFVLEQCTKGLAFLHKSGIIHRDLKPANILLNSFGQVKISDFGFSKQMNSGVSAASISGAFGTAHWLAPEVLISTTRRARVNMVTKMTAKADIFSLGCLFFFVLSTGQHLFGNEFERLQNIVSNSPRWGNILLTDLSKKLIAKMVSHTPEERPTAQEILQSEYFGTFEDRQSSDNTVAVLYQSLPLPSTTKNTHLQHVSKPTVQITGRIQTEKLVKENHAVETSNKNANMTENFRNNLSKEQFLDELAKRNNISDEYLTRLKSNINALTENGNTLLHLAAKQESVECLASLVHLGANCNIKNNHGSTVMHFAVEGGNYQAIKYFKTLDVEINPEDRNAPKPIHHITNTKENFKETLRALVDCGADINARTVNGNNLLLLATHSGCSKEQIEEIVKLGGDWTARNIRGYTVLHWAVRAGNYKAIPYLVSLGADLNWRNQFKETPLLQIVETPKKDFLETLNVLVVEHGVDINAVDGYGCSVLELARQKGRSQEEMNEIVRLGGVHKQPCVLQ